MKSNKFIAFLCCIIFVFSGVAAGEDNSDPPLQSMSKISSGNSEYSASSSSKSKKKSPPTTPINTSAKLDDTTRIKGIVESIIDSKDYSTKKNVDSLNRKLDSLFGEKAKEQPQNNSSINIWIIIISGTSLLISLILVIYILLRFSKLEIKIINNKKELDKIEEPTNGISARLKKLEESNKSQKEQQMNESQKNEINKIVEEIAKLKTEIQQEIKQEIKIAIDKLSITTQPQQLPPITETLDTKTSVTPAEFISTAAATSQPIPPKEEKITTFYLGLPNGDKIKNDRVGSNEIYAYLECTEKGDTITFKLTNKCYERLGNGDVYDQLSKFCKFTGSRFEMKSKRTTKVGFLKLENGFYKSVAKAEVEL